MSERFFSRLESWRLIACQTPSLPDAAPRSHRPRCGGRGKQIPSSNCRAIIEHLTKTLPPERITAALNDVMNDSRLSPEERRTAGRALSEVLTARLSFQAKEQARKN